MDEPILRFVAALRAAGVRVSPPEAADALTATAHTGLDDRDTFRAALRATLVKRDLDLDTFDRLFPLHFDPFGSHAADLPGLPAAGAGELAGLPPEALEALGPELAGLLERLLSMGDLELALLVREAGRPTLAGLETLLQQGMATRTILEGLAAYCQRINDSGH